jgi:cell division protein FtsZ
MFEVDEAAKIITESVDTDANIIFGATINEDYTGELKITVVATGFDENTNQAFVEKPKISKAPFGKKAITDSRVTNNKATTTTATKAAKPKPAVKIEDDLDIPAFLRKKK